MKAFVSFVSFVVVIEAAVASQPALQTRLVVRSPAEVSAALAKARPGTTIALASGVYDLALSSTNLGGTAAAPIVIESADPANPAIIRGPGSGMKFTDASYVTVRHLVFERQAEHAVNIDDGDSYATPSHHITLSDLTIRDTGTHGIAAAIKMSGVQDFAIERATIVNWGTGSAITLVGAHRGVIRESLFRHADDAGATGVQMKGGSTAIVVRENRFEHASVRAVQIGGSTDDQFFRPQPAAAFEAKDCTVERNVFIGSEAVVAFVNTDGSMFRDNTIYRPRKWLLRILQERTGPRFVPARRGDVDGNIIYYLGADFPIGAVNAGEGTDPASFRFARNWWYRTDDPGASAQPLPTRETDGVYGRDPMFVNPGGGDFHLRPGSPATAYGVYAPIARRPSVR